MMFDNCMAYNKLEEPTKIHWLREPCKLLIRELAALAPSLPSNAGKADFEEVLRKLKLVRLAGYTPYYDFEMNPSEYYLDYGSVAQRPMGIKEALRCPG